MLQARVNGFAFQGKYPKCALVNAPQWFVSDKAFQALDTQGKFAQGQRAFSPQTTLA
jgi:hypothetical protein